jgi:FAD/FMN-containing dehydrogenase
MEVIADIKNEPGVDLATIEAEAKVLSDLKRDNPSLAIFTPSSPFFAQVRQIQSLSITDVPLAIVWPRSEADVANIVKYAVAQDIAFCVRSGGHDYYGRSMQEGKLVIDLRCMNKVEIAGDNKTATVQGGTLTGSLNKMLSEKGLVTTLPAGASVSYAGFAIFGGYGPVSGTYGLGNDNIVGAKLVGGDGEIVEANDDLLFAIRGAGGAFGVITELKIKIYDLPTVRGFNRCYQHQS